MENFRFGKLDSDDDSLIVDHVPAVLTVTSYGSNLDNVPEMYGTDDGIAVVSFPSVRHRQPQTEQGVAGL